MTGTTSTWTVSGYLSDVLLADEDSKGGSGAHFYSGPDNTRGHGGWIGKATRVRR